MGAHVWRSRLWQSVLATIDVKNPGSVARSEGKANRIVDLRPKS